MSFRQLDYVARRGYVVPTRQATGTGQPGRLWSPEDLASAVIAIELGGKGSRHGGWRREAAATGPTFRVVMVREGVTLAVQRDVVIADLLTRWPVPPDDVTAGGHPRP